MEANKHRLVFGLGSGLIYSLGNKGGWKKYLPRLLKAFDNDYLISTVDMPSTITSVIVEHGDTKDRCYIDSGGFTLFKDEMKLGKDNPEFHKKCEKMKNKFLKLLKNVPCKETFELDNEYFRVVEDPLSPKNYCREDVKKITGFYPTPVFKLHQGIEYWKRLCECELYPRLAIGGLAQTNDWGTQQDTLKHLMDLARIHGKKVHLLGCQNAKAFKIVQPSTVDYSIFQFSINIGRAKAEHPELTVYNDIAKHACCFAVANARVRTFLYDSYKIEK